MSVNVLATAQFSSNVLVAWVGTDFPQYLPLVETLEHVLVPMEDTVHYLPLGNASEDAWLSASSAGYGYIRLQDDRTFVTSMFHELHCLRMINRAFTKDTKLAHVWHCLNYIRQNVLCSPDLALEPGTYFEERDFAVERDNGVHMCRDWDEIYRYFDDNFINWSTRTGFSEFMAYRTGARVDHHATEAHRYIPGHGR